MMKIDAKTLKQLYWKDGLTTYEIASKLGIPRSTILYWMEKFNIPRRKRLRDGITKDILKQLYCKERLSLRKIAKILNASYSTICKKMKEFNIRTRKPHEANMRYLKKKFSNDLKEKAYLIGLRCGDINAHKASNQIRVSTSSTHLTQIEMFRNAFEKYSKVNLYVASNDKTGEEIRVHCLLDKSFKFLLNKLKKIPNWILKKKEYFFAFLSGYIDCEGYWQIYQRKTTGRTFARLRIATEDKLILKQIHKKLQSLGFNPKFRLVCKRNTSTSFGKIKKDVYEISVNSTKDVLKLAKTLLKFSRHIEKIWKMKFILRNIGKKWSQVKYKLEKFKKHVKETTLNKSSIQLQQFLHYATTGADEYLLRIFFQDYHL